MKIFLIAVLYLALGFILACVVELQYKKDREYSIRDFDDLANDEQGIITATLLFWPIMLVLVGVYTMLQGIIKLVNRKDDHK